MPQKVLKHKIGLETHGLKNLEKNSLEFIHSTTLRTYHQQ